MPQKGKSWKGSLFQTVNKSEDFKSNQMGVHGGVYLYISQLCKVESSFLWNKYLPKNTWSLAASNKLLRKRSREPLLTSLQHLNQTCKDGRHSFCGVCPIFDVHLFQKSALLENWRTRHIPLNQENCKHKQDINPDQQLTLLALLNL